MEDNHITNILEALGLVLDYIKKTANNHLISKMFACSAALDIIDTINSDEFLFKKCPNCGSRDLIMFTSDDDMCKSCNKTFPSV